MATQDIISTDVLIIGGGPSGLATAIKLADELKQKGLQKRIILIEKGLNIGSHILSGAVIMPEVLRELLPNEDISNIPFDSKVGEDSTIYLTNNDSFTLPFHPPYMANEGNYIASLGHLCKFLASKAIERGVEIYTGFSVDEILYEKDSVIGAKTKDTGINHHGEKMENFQEGSSIKANITIFAEGTRGSLAKTLIKKLNLDKDKNAQIYSLGIKELWSVPNGNIKAGSVYHTMGYPLKYDDEFGGGFIYGLSDNRVALGLVVGLDYKDPTFDIHGAMQVWKTHPFVKNILSGGSLLEFGAKTLPEGGFYSVPKFYGNGFMIVGDSAGLLVTAKLKGVHLAIESGINAAISACEALEQNDFSESKLAKSKELFDSGMLYQELYPVRNFRQAFNSGMIFGGLQFGLQLLSGGAGIFGKLATHNDNETLCKLTEISTESFKDRFGEKLDFDKKLTFDKVTNVYFSKTNHDEMQLCHLVINDMESFKNINIAKFGAPCQYFCPAEVYELHTDKSGHQELRIHAENCVHCKTCDIKSPAKGITWTTPYGGDGPDYQYM